MRSSSRFEFVVGSVFALIAVIEGVFFGWDSSETNHSLPFVLGVLATVLAVLFFVRDR